MVLGADPQQAIAHDEGLAPISLQQQDLRQWWSFLEPGCRKPRHSMCIRDASLLDTLFLHALARQHELCLPSCMQSPLQPPAVPLPSSHRAKPSSPLQPALPPKPHRPPGGEAEIGLSTGAGSCQHPLSSPERSFKKGTESCSPHQEFLNQTAFSQIACRLERDIGSCLQ